MIRAGIIITAAKNVTSMCMGSSSFGTASTNFAGCCPFHKTGPDGTRFHGIRIPKRLNWLPTPKVGSAPAFGAGAVARLGQVLAEERLQLVEGDGIQAVVERDMIDAWNDHEFLRLGRSLVGILAEVL